MPSARSSSLIASLSALDGPSFCLLFDDDGERLEGLGDLGVLVERVVLGLDLVDRLAEVEDRLHVLLARLADLGIELQLVVLVLILVLFLQAVELIDDPIVLGVQDLPLPVHLVALLLDERCPRRGS